MLTSTDRTHQRNMPLRFGQNQREGTAAGHKPLWTGSPFAWWPLGMSHGGPSQPSPWGSSRAEVNRHAS